MTTPRQAIEAKAGPIDYGRLRELLEQQESLFLRLDALSRQQSSLVRDEQTDDLLRVLGERQTVVETLEAVARGLEPFRDRWEAVLAGARPDQRDRLARQVEQLAELASAIAARDDADRRLIEERRDRLAGDLAGMGRVRGAVAAYGAGRGRPAARFQDREG